ncbi:TetR/AcrR family transcriptional regulator [Saccharospirillum salsuginis]|uniref:TetR family transcriptional regulator n=1 Tax=Saccharospirillum salsuginis TaxID=418750 RepID=A0A918N6I8_9GAMM|nr:TetR/AcrR family transcriptional regulator [Saccharospirillum salsuginis]GGX43612.1 TetR family transcriptional regulator [Saccharospirillum salsuginis]
MNSTPHKGRAEDWLEAAYDAFIQGGVEAVKIQPLAKALNTSRTSFYWFFKDREALLDQLVERWKEKNTAGLIRQTERYADSIVEAMLNVFDCWLDERLFDSEFEYAVRHWAMQSPEVAQAVATADEQRLEALTRMLIRFGYSEHEAGVRARTTYLTQIGYISMHTQESTEERIGRVAEYVEVFTGQPCERSDLERFVSRHAPNLTDWMAAYDDRGALLS